MATGSSRNDLTGAPGEVVVEQGFASDWNLEVGESVYIDTIGNVRIAGIALAPDDVAYPLASRARLWLANNWVSDIFVGNGRTVNVAQVWAQDPDQLDPMLVQARQVSFGLENLKFVTVEGVRSLVGQASGW